MGVVSFTPLPPYHQGRSPWYPLDRKLDGLQSLSVRGGEERSPQPLSELEPSIIQLEALRLNTDLSWLPVPFKVENLTRWTTISFSRKAPPLESVTGSRIEEYNSSIWPVPIQNSF
jgi:hypothetical protein